MGPKAVVARGNAEASEEVVKNGEEEGLPTEFGEGSANEAYNWGDAENDDVEPVKVVAPISPVEGRKGFLCREGVLDVVVGDVEVGGNVVVDLGFLLRSRHRSRRSRRLWWGNGGHERR